jgi:pimeloyl-ACP methyl ester carboxylesterase
MKTFEVISNDGTKLVVDTVGNPSNPPVVFCHGASSAANLFDAQFNDPELSDDLYMVRHVVYSDHTCLLFGQVRYDLRAFGRSGKPATSESFTPQRYAEDFAAVCKPLKIIKPIYVGWSFGCICFYSPCSQCLILDF